jgi:hypothetical protein
MRAIHAFTEVKMCASIGGGVREEALPEMVLIVVVVRVKAEVIDFFMALFA